MASQDSSDTDDAESSPVVAVVDDDDAVLRSLRNLLTSAGPRVQTFASAEAFWDSETRHNASCLVLDLRMPGMSGTELLSRVSASERPLPTLILTADGDDDVRRRLLSLGAIAFFTKPYRVAEMLTAVRSALAKPKVP